MLKTHLTVIPKLAMGILESNGHIDPAVLDHFMNTILRSRISRRVIAEQHLALTETFGADWFSPGAKLHESDFIGEVFIKCVARDVVERCSSAVEKLARSTYGPDVRVPEIKINGHLDASFPFILSHIEYIIGELLRNAVQAVIERQQRLAAEGGLDATTAAHHQQQPPPPPIEVTICEAQQHVMIRISDQGGGIPTNELPYLWSFSSGPQSRRRLENLRRPPPIEVTICEAQQHVMIRISDQGGGIPTNELPYLWSFSSGPQSRRRLENLRRVPKLAATMQELHVSDELGRADLKTPSYESSLASLTGRPPNLRLGIGLPLSRVYAEYWAGGLELHSLWGYGVDAFLQISKLGNKNEQLTTRASMDAI
ncbi:hypothetical protein BN1723_004185 [Verticillium longisporum]|uniref:Protein-serine/threonine kinase n=1 Tax=Verticillium longisporum TaxID=100787 RepID=A0A0G4MQ82_VERLO|nr:hypothetical protein BN1723_004185 [Verticillium longisporum]